MYGFYECVINVHHLDIDLTDMDDRRCRCRNKDVCQYTVLRVLFCMELIHVSPDVVVINIGTLVDNQYWSLLRSDLILRLRPLGTWLLNLLIHIDSNSSRISRLNLESGCPFAKFNTWTVKDLDPSWSGSLKCLPTMWDQY